MTKSRTCNKCKNIIPQGQEYIKLQSNKYDGKKIFYKNLGDLCMNCFINLTKPEEKI